MIFLASYMREVLMITILVILIINFMNFSSCSSMILLEYGAFLNRGYMKTIGEVFHTVSPTGRNGLKRYSNAYFVYNFCVYNK
jgi:hypothetical protein